MIFFILITVIALLLFVKTISVPAVAIVGVWCMYSIEQWAQGSSIFFIRNNSLINLTIGSAVLLGVIVNYIKYNNIFKNYPGIAFPILILFVYSFISITWAPRIDLSYDLWGKYWPYLITFLLLSPLLIAKEEDFKPVLNMFIITGGIVVFALLFYVEWFHRRIVFIGSRYNNELLGNPLAVSQMAGYLFIVCMFMLRKNTTNKFNLLLVIIKWVIASICLLLIVKSGSRGQLLGLIVTFIIFYPLVYKLTSLKGFVLVFIVTLLVGGAILWGLDEFWGKSDRWNQDSMESSMSGRFDNASILLQHWFRDPITIVFGLGNSASYDPKIIGIYPHFVPFEVLGEEGLIGIVFYSIILIGIIRIGFRLFKITQSNVLHRQYFTILLSMVCYSFFLSLKQGSLLGNIEFFMAAIILGKYELIIKNGYKKDVKY